VDWNSDGRRDLVSGDRDGYFNYFIQGTSEPTAYYKMRLQNGDTLDVGWNSHPQVTDWNRDGKKDLLVGNSDGYIRCYLNVGTNAAPVFEDYSYIYSGPGTPINLVQMHPLVVDLDQDGRRDLVCGAEDGYLHYFRNVGTDTNPAFSGEETLRTTTGTLILPTNCTISRAAFADWNNDGQLDFLISGSFGWLELYLGAPGDVGTSTLVSPTGTVDSGSTVTPACSVYNYGTTTASYSVRMKIGTGYNYTASVASHAPGARRYVTFPAWTASQRGSFAVRCSTQLAGDEATANDKKTGTVAVRVRDVECVRIIVPTGGCDSGVVVTPACTLRNRGTAAETYTVRCKLGAFYNQTVSVSSHTSGSLRKVSFPVCTLKLKGAFTASCSTQLTGDQIASNNRKTASITVAVVDAGCIKLLGFASSTDSGRILTPSCTVYNYSATTKTYPVRMKVGTFYNRTATVSSHAAGTPKYLTFPPCTLKVKGTHAVSCSTELASDARPANNRLTGTLTVKATDVQCLTLVRPSGTYDSGTIVVPACTTYNAGGLTVTYNVRMKVGSFYNKTVSAASHAPGAKRYLTFPACTLRLRGTYTVICSTALAGDARPANNGLTATITVNVRDVACSRIVAPAGAYDSGTIVTPVCTLRNNGTVAETYTARMKVGTFYNRTATASSHAAGTLKYVAFPPCTMKVKGTLAVSCSTELAADKIPANNKKTGSFTVAVVDAGCIKLLGFASSTDSGRILTPSCTVYNYSATTKTYPVRMKVGTFYNRTATASSHAAGTRKYLTFPPCTLKVKGTHAVSCSTELAKDARPANNRLTGTLTVKATDVQCLTLVRPSGTYDSGTIVVPACTTYNAGGRTVTYSVRMKVGSFYNRTVSAASHAPGAKRYLTFPACTLRLRGTYTVSCSTELSGDARPTNNRKTGSVYVGATLTGALSIVVPNGAVDSGTTVTPRVLVQNAGHSGTVPVRLRIVPPGAAPTTEDQDPGGGTEAAGQAEVQATERVESAAPLYDETVLAALDGSGPVVVSFRPWQATVTGSYSFDVSATVPDGVGSRELSATRAVTVKPTASADGSGAMAKNGLLPTEYGLSARPNPFTRMTCINYQLPVAGNADIKLYDVTGKLVRTIASGKAEAGYYSRVLNSPGLARGIYLLKFESGNFLATRQLVLR